MTRTLAITKPDKGNNSDTLYRHDYLKKQYISDFVKPTDLITLRIYSLLKTYKKTILLRTIL